MNIPNSLTLFRIVLIPVLVALFYWPLAHTYFLTAAVFAIAAVTDWLDGYLARKLSQTTPLGAFLDPVADKLMVAVALALLIERYDAAWFTIPAVIIIGREIVISALREWMAELGKRTSVAVSYIGKVKTAMQMIAIFGWLLVSPNSEGMLYYASIICLYTAAVLTLWSMVIYLHAAWPDLRDTAGN
ncbi:CDP-diacylglycerol--glycerol-3-phosphate 3-phosphatidyltransferase [Zhongshania aliphaticivorans]|uniref:CDP-diacylglycerol--glycerol-3-phosphate 3-phosphatidyltransferase n=1 Tax=Zhongshania aliphaticivorans TaxID=1470434 RepID=A0A5S9QPE1_9GAMM|nr:CDP-diacylglycerol--glycerol-3-phosphate 3-phosphatidyltransferase [Zhongshania aliphaticivorans]CAA0088450.1 CDP-diacylglycerol--glycerol-3-phosphate 3-phosphatidyltransferase [Zhongshania aliphaticivorans]CAA0120532.1 CDP-diacylglycerol--glycerol-3-phosphate 3-phosphatidyltransferase [Zhongshania aliphaticivorans]